VGGHDHQVGFAAVQQSAEDRGDLPLLDLDADLDAGALAQPAGGRLQVGAVPGENLLMQITRGEVVLL